MNESESAGGSIMPSSPLYVEINSDDSLLDSKTTGDCCPPLAGEAMRDLQLQSAWAAFCQSSSLSTNEKGEYLNKFLCLLLETTPHHIPTINRLNFSKHQVISSYIGSHFLVELENLCRNTSLLSRVKGAPENDEHSTLPPSQSRLGQQDQELHSISLPPTLKEHPKYSSSAPASPASSSSLSLSSAKSAAATVGRLPSNLEPGNGELDAPSETSLRVHHSEESASSSSSSFRTVDTTSSAKSEFRKRSTRRDMLQFLDRKQDPALHSGSSDRGSERTTGVEDKRIDVQGIDRSSLNLESDTLRDQSRSPPPSPFQKAPENSKQQKEEELMASIKSFLTVGRGARMLMVLDQIGAVGTTVGYEVVKFLGYIFECLLDEMIANEGIPQNASYPTRNKADLLPQCEYQPMISEVKLRDIFKPILHPRNPPATHPTCLVEAYLSGDASSKRRSASSCSNSVRRSNKRSRRRRNSMLPESKIDSEEEGEKMRKQYVQYKKTLQTCECFHPESLLKRRNDAEDPDVIGRRPTCLQLNQLLDVILSVIVQFSLYDPYSNSIDHYSDKCARHVIGFSFKMLAKLASGDLSDCEGHSDRITMLQRFSDPLIKIVFSGCQKFLKNSSLFKAFTKLNVPEQLFQFAGVLLDISKNMGNFVPSSQSTPSVRLWLVSTLEDIAIGIALLLKSLCCDRQESVFIKNESFPIWRFLSAQYMSVLRDIFSLSLELESDKALVIIQSFSKLILYLKMLKEDFLHSSKCEKSGHKYCDYSPPFLSHHFHYFGTNKSPMKDDHFNECLISVLAQLLLNFFHRCQDTSVSLKILDLMSKCGFCCCMKLYSVLPHLLNGIEKRQEMLQNAITVFIESVVWSEFDGLNASNNRLESCGVCKDEDCRDHSDFGDEHHKDVEHSFKKSPKKLTRWVGLSEYSKYIFSPSVGPLITDHIAKVIQMSKPEVSREISDKLLVKSMRTLIASRYEVAACDSTTSSSITKNLLKCLRLSYLHTCQAPLLKLMKDDGLNIIEHCKKNPATRFEALHLLCSLVDKEQILSREALSDLSNKKNFILNGFSRYYLSEIYHHEAFWMQRFEESSLHVRRKVNIKTMPTFQRRRNRSYENKHLPEVFEEGCSTAEFDKVFAEVTSKEYEYNSGEERETETTNDSCNIKSNDYATLVEMYSNVADLWQLTSEMVLRSSDFLNFIAKSSVCDVVAPFLISIIQDYARGSNNLLETPSVVYRNLGTTLALCRSLLTTMILCFSRAGHDLEKPLEEVRHHILRISSSNCADIRSFISMLLQCSVLARERAKRPQNNGGTTSILESQMNCFRIESEDSSLVETDGYDGDTEYNQPKRSNSSSSVESEVLSNDGGLECPELLVCALDLVVSHHQRYLEAKEFSQSDSGSKSKFTPNKKENVYGDHTSPKSKSMSENKKQETPEKNDDKAMISGNRNDEKELTVETTEDEKGKTNNGKKILGNESDQQNFASTDSQAMLATRTVELDSHQTKNTDEKISEGLNSNEFREAVEPEDCKEQGKDVKKSPSSAKSKRKKARRKRSRRKNHKEFTSTEDMTLSSTMKDFSKTTEEVNLDKSLPSEQCDNSSYAKDHLLNQEEGSCLSSEDKNLVVTSVENEKPCSSIGQLDESSLNSQHHSSSVTSPEKSSPYLPGTSSSFSSSYTVNTGSTSLSSFLKPPLCTSVEECHVSVLSQTLHDILIICRGSESVCLQLQSLSFLRKLIDGFSKLIKNNEPSYEELISIIASLWCEVAQHHLEASQLSQYFGLFKAPKPPVNTLLRALCRAFDNGCRDPHFSLRFLYPFDREAPILGLGDAYAKSLMTSLTSLTSFVQVEPPMTPAAEAITALRSSQILHGVTSCVSVCNLVCPIPRSLDWSLYNDGASVATWLSVQRRYRKCTAYLSSVKRGGLVHDNSPFKSKGNNEILSEKKASISKGVRIHALSIGTQHLMFSVWIDAISDKIYVTATSESERESTVIDEACVEKTGLKNSEWHHLAFVLPKISVRKGGPIAITLLFDGLRRFEIQLFLPPITSVKKSTPSYLIIGHTDSSVESFVEERGAQTSSTFKTISEETEETVLTSSEESILPSDTPSSPSYTLSLGIIYVFHEPVLTIQNCLGLISLGKNASSLLVAAPEPHKTAFAPLISRKLLSSKIDCSFLFKDLRTLLSPLQESLLLQFSPHTSSEYIYYKKSTPVHPDHTGTPYPVCITQQSIIFNPVNIVEKRSPELALLKLGGASHLAFLVARIAELGDSQKNFADSISLVFKICRTEPNISFQFSIFGGPSLICRLLMAPTMLSGVLVLKALLEACIEPSIIQFEACRNVFFIAPHIPAYINDRGLLETILDNWKCFLNEGQEERKQDEYVCLDPYGKELSCIGIILSVMTVLLREGCHFKKFNLIQLCDIRALNKIIHMFEEMKAEGLPFETICSAELIVNVISLLLGVKSQQNLFSSNVNSSSSSSLPQTGLNLDDQLTDQSDDPLSSMGLIMPDLKGAELKELGYFLLFLHPDEFTYVTTDKRHAFYLTHQTNSAKKKRTLDTPFASSSFRDVNKALNSKFSQFSLRGEVPQVTVDSSPDGSPVRPFIEEGEEALSNSTTSAISPNKSPSIEGRANTHIYDIKEEQAVEDIISVKWVDAVMSSPSKSEAQQEPKTALKKTAKIELNKDTEIASSEAMLTSEVPISIQKFTIGDQEIMNFPVRIRSERLLSLPELHLRGENLKKVRTARSFSVDCCHLYEKQSMKTTGESEYFAHGVNVTSSTKCMVKFDEDDKNEPLISCSISQSSFEGATTRNNPEESSSLLKVDSIPTTTKDNDSKLPDDTTVDSSEESVATLPLLTVGLLNAVEEALRNLSQTQAAVVISEMFSIDLVVLFANHPEAAVRAASLGLFRTILLRSRKEYCSFHLKRNIVHLISLQLHKHSPASEALVAEAFALALKLDLKLDDVTIKDVVLSPNHKFSLFVPLFAILPTCVFDIAMCHNTLTTFLHILKMNEDLLIKIYLKTHFIDSLLLTVRNALHDPSGSCYDDTSPEAKIIIEDVTEILCYLVHQLVASEGNAPFTTCREVLSHVNLFYRMECDKCGYRAVCSLVFLDIESSLLEGALYKLRRTSVTVAHHQSQFIMLPADSTSSTNSDEEEMKNLSRSKHFEGLRRFTNFFQRTPYNKETNNRSLPNAKRSARTYGNNRLGFDSESPTELSPGMQRLTLNNLAESYKTILQLSVHYVILTAQKYRELRPQQERFALSLLEVLCSSIRIITEYESSGINKQPQSLEYLALSCATIAEHFWCLLTHLIAPEMNFSVRVETIRVINMEPEIRKIFNHCMRSDMAFLYRFGIFVHELRYKFKNMSSEIIEEIDSILATLDACGVITLPPPEGKLTEWTVVSEEKRRWHEDKLRFISAIVQQNTLQNKRYLTKPKLDLAHEQICAEGNRMSWQLLEIQNERLKAALKRVRDSQCRRIKFTYCWRDIVDLVTHEKAAWYFPEAFPSGWKLDATEGPMRIRKRMMRCFLNIDKKFFHTCYLERHDKTTPPLQALLVDTEIESALSHIVESINEDEKLVHTCHAAFVAPTVEQKGEFLISHKNLYYIGEESAAKNSSDTPTVISKFWPGDVVREIHLRRYRLKDCAIELFSTDGQSALLAFQDEKERKKVMRILSTMHFPNIMRETSLGEYTSMWREGVITNFDYLTQLNKLAGRSFNDLMQYPIFPFVFSDYTSKFLNLEDPSIYRILRKPIPIQKEEKEEHFRRNYEASKHMSPDGPYHYGSHYSNSGIVLYYLIRLPPFTQLFLDFQDGSFDVPDRSFHTLETTWRLAASESTTAIRELIPEFFFLPEVFSNTQGFKFGTRQNGEMVNHVNLPPWCHGDPRRFILVHRASLESYHVTRNLQHWIDLVFGFKQEGKAAIEAINVFHPATYFGFDVEIDSDELAIEARRTMIKTYGQTPRQLLTYPHPSPSIGTFLHFKTVPSPKNEIPQALTDVSGIPWGIYAGSPADPKPSVPLVQSLQTNVRSMMTLSSNEVILLAPNMVIHTVKSRKAEVPSLYRYIISWNYNDGIVRCRRHKASIVYPLISVPLYNKVTCCVMSQKQLWLGTECGQILVYLVSPLHGKGGELVANTPNHPLTAHSAAISCLVISHDFKVCFSGGADGAVVLWDTNRLAYIRSVTVTEARMSFVAVSETLGDWVSVTHAPHEDQSVLRYYTINAEFIESVHVESKVTCVTFSNAPEGRNINVIAVGSSDRAIRLFSTWDLSLIRVLRNDKVKDPPISLLYTEDNYHLCVITENQILVVWETTQLKCKMPKFVTVGPC